MAEFIEKLDSDVSNLKTLMSECTTKTIIDAVRIYWVSSINLEEKFQEGIKLKSPAKQISFLLSLMLSTVEPVNGKVFSKEDWEVAKQLLEDIFGVYQNLFWPTDEELENLSEEWWHVRDVAMPSFIHYFNTALLASIEQISARVEKYCSPFDTSLKELTGISSTEAIQIAKHIQVELQLQFQSLEELAIKERKNRLKILLKSKIKTKNFEDFEKLVQEEIKNSTYSENLIPFLEAIEKVGVISLNHLKNKFPETGEAYWNNFTIKRGEGPIIKYPTESSIYEKKPIILLNQTEASCPYPNKLFEAVLSSSEEILKNGGLKKSFLKRRDNILEEEAKELFRKILGPNAKIYCNAFENANSHLEHDLIIISGNKLLVVEAKASPPIEPFRNPEKAFTRIKRAFKSDSGIQSAFEQGNRIIKRLNNKEIVPLYDKNGNQLVELNPNFITEKYCICVTRDDFGYLATNLSLLLEKEVTDNYPWVINILDLKHLMDTWKYFGWRNIELFKYISERVKCHGKVSGSDELEFLGAFIHHGTLKYSLSNGFNNITLNPSYSHFFDDLYFHLYHDAHAPKVEVVKPVIMDMRKSLESNEPVFIKQNNLTQANKLRKIGRNDLCYCGSGKKYKKCHM